MMRHGLKTPALAGMLLLLPTTLVRGAGPGRTPADCDRLSPAGGATRDTYRCYYEAGLQSRDKADIAARLEGVLQLDPDDHWARYWLGRLYGSMGRRPREQELVRGALDGFVAEGDAEGEVRSRVTMAIYHDNRGEDAVARDQLDRALTVASESGDRNLEAEVEIALSRLDRKHGDHGSGWSRLKRAQAIVFPDGPVTVRSAVLEGLASISWYLEHYKEAWNLYEEQKELLGPDHPGERAIVLRNQASLGPYLVKEGLMTREDLAALCREAVAAAQQAGRRRAAIGARIALAQNLEGPEAVEEARRALALTRERRDADMCWALWVLARKLVDLDPKNYEEAHALAEEALEHGRRRGNRYMTVQSLLTRARLTRMAGPRETAIAESLEALAAVEQMRYLQLDREIRSRAFGRFVEDYHRVADWLLDPGNPDPEELELAWTILERMRARELLDVLDASGSTVPMEGTLATRHEEVLREISDVQRRLVAPALAEDERSAILVRLEELEFEERDLRQQYARDHPDFAAIHEPRFATLEEFAAALGPEQAGIFFYRSGEPDDGVDRPRALIVTREDSEVVELPARRQLESMGDLFISLLERRDGSEADGARRLGEEIFGPVLPALPAAVDELIVAPYGFLHRVSLGALTLPGGEEPIAARFQITVVPSGTTWMRWRDAGEPEGEWEILSLADPELPFERGAASWRDAGVFAEPVSLGRLPHARDEARRLREWLGGGEFLEGPRASEAALKARSLDTVRVMHFAAHALVDARRPQRSAIVLAPGASDQDGLLQIREVLDLRLAGPVVILSACRTASGDEIDGEGVMSLSNAFFRAGARTVIASLWPLRDDEAAAMMEELARHLGTGASVGRALALARRGLMSRSMPRAAWAGLVLYGDGHLIPIPGGRPGIGWGPVLGGGLLILLLGLTLALRRLRTPKGDDAPPVRVE